MIKKYYKPALHSPYWEMKEYYPDIPIRLPSSILFSEAYLVTSPGVRTILLLMYYKLEVLRIVYGRAHIKFCIRNDEYGKLARTDVKKAPLEDAWVLGYFDTVESMTADSIGTFTPSNRYELFPSKDYQPFGQQRPYLSSEMSNAGDIFYRKDMERKFLDAITRRRSSFGRKRVWRSWS